MSMFDILFLVLAISSVVKISCVKKRTRACDHGFFATCHASNGEFSH